MKRLFQGTMIASVCLAFTFIIFSGDAEATSAFARKYGLSCTTCHSVTFPRLNYYGEQFMRNGFQTPGSQDGSSTGKNKIADDLTLAERLGNIMGVRGKIRVYENQEQNASGAGIGSTQGSTIFGAIFASGTIADNIPVWMEFETNTSNGETELHNYFVGWTNIGGTTLANVRVGGFTPTEWTSFSDQKRSFDAPVSHPGAFRPSKFNKDAVNPYNLRTNTGVEYYGYTGPVFWAVGVTDMFGGNYNATSGDGNKDYYIVLRGEMPEGPAEGSSISFLAYQANLGGDDDSDPSSGTAYNTHGDYMVYDISGNLRMGPFDVMAAYVWDSDRVLGSKGDDDTGFTIEADYKVMNNLIGILRYDTFDDGLVTQGDSQTSTWAVGAVYAPRENLKITASYTIDTSDDTSLTSSSSGNKYGENNNIWDVELQFMF